MSRSIVSGIMLTLLFIGVLTWGCKIQPVKAEIIDTTPPIITILEPKNQTYGRPEDLCVTIDEPASWIGYSLNHQVNTTLYYISPWPANKTIWASLPLALVEEANVVRVYANDTSGNMGSSEVYFTIAFPFLSVEPKNYTASHINEVLSINIMINDLNESWELGAVAFCLRYNHTILQFLDVTDGPFMKHFAELNLCYRPIEEVYFFMLRLIEPGVIFVGLGICYGGCWSREYPQGNGAIATITFQTIAESAPSILLLANTALDDEWANEIPHNLEHGYYRLEPLLGDLNLNGNVDIQDIAICSLAFGSFPSHPRWNPIADITHDNRVDIRDVALIAGNFGKTRP